MGFGLALTGHVGAQSSAARLTARPSKPSTTEQAANTSVVKARYVGSLACQRCHATTYERWSHTKHPPGSRGSDGVECHMPRIEPTIANVNVRSHTFKFITPAMSSAYKIPNPCVLCHTSQTNEWATEQLEKWDNVSPWRIQ
jgi:hypothetical protein